MDNAGQPTRQILQHPPSARCVAHRVGLVEGGAYRGAQRLGQGFGDIVLFVLDTTLNQYAWTQHLDYRLAQRLGAVAGRLSQICGGRVALIPEWVRAGALPGKPVKALGKRIKSQ